VTSHADGIALVRALQRMSSCRRPWSRPRSHGQGKHTGNPRRWRARPTRPLRPGRSRRWCPGRSRRASRSCRRGAVP